MTFADIDTRPVSTAVATRGYLAVAGGDVHLRSWPSALPPLVLLHDSPGSGAGLVQLAADLADRYAVYVPDLPGHGGTTVPSVDGPAGVEGARAVDGPAAVEGVVRSLAAAIGQLGLSGVAVVGVGFGGVVARGLADILGAGCRGSVVCHPPGPAPAPTAAAAPAAATGPGGGRLLDVWWALRRAAEPPTAAELHEVAVDVLEAGVHPVTAGQPDPGLWIDRWDSASIEVGLDRLPGLDRWPGGDRLPGGGRPAPLTAPADDPPAARAPAARAPAARAPTADTGAATSGVRSRYVPAGGGLVHVRFTTATAPTPSRGGRRPWVILPTLPGSGRSALPLLESLAGRRTAVAVDYPGHGRSDPMPTGRACLADYVEVLEETAQHLGLGRVHALGSHSGALLAILWQRRYPERVASLALDGVPLGEAFSGYDLDRYLPDLSPQPDGDHLLRAWAMAVGRQRASPWYGDWAPAALSARPRADDEAARWVCDLLRGAATYHQLYRLILTYALERDGAPAVAVPTLLCRTPGDALATTHQRVAALLPHAVPRQTWGFADLVAAARTAAVLTEFTDPLDHPDHREPR